MRKFFIAFIILSIQLFWSGCFKDHLLGEFLLTEEMKSQNPFRGGETLYFMSDSAEEFVLDGGLRRDQVYKYQPSVTESAYYLIEVETTSMGSFPALSIYMRMEGVVNSAPMFTIYIHSEKKGGSFKFTLPLNTETTDHIDSIRVRDKWYHNVFINEQDSDTAIRANKLYYSTRYGVIKIEWPDGHFIELEKIE